MKSKIIKVIQVIHHRDDTIEIITDARRRFTIPVEKLREEPQEGEELVLKWNDKIEDIEVWYKDKKLVK